MKLTSEQQCVVEQNLGLVGKVIKDKVHGIGQSGMFTYDDLFQIGCIGLCKAAATDKGGCFSTYAYRIIWNEICDALIQATRLCSKEDLQGTIDYHISDCNSVQERLEKCEVKAIIADMVYQAPDLIAKGIHCLLLAENGYSSKELGYIYSTEPAAVRMWMTKARRYMKNRPELVEFRKEIG